MKKSMLRCSACGKEVSEERMAVIDNRYLCPTCLYGESKPFEIYPIGYVRNESQTHKKGFGLHGKKNISRIEMLPSQKRFMYRLEEEKDLTIVYYLHETKSVKSIFKRGMNGKQVGVFASRTPYRPSKIGIQDVHLLKVEGTTLYVEGLDARDGSPILDIKVRRRTTNH